MDSPTDLFDDSTSQMHAFAPPLCTADLAGVPQSNEVRPPSTFRPPGFPLIHHFLQSGGTPRAIGGQLSTHNPNLNIHRQNRNIEEDRGKRDVQMEQGTEGGEGVREEDGNLLGVKKRHNEVALAAEWNQDVLRVKRMKLESRRRDAERVEGSRRHERGREGRRREREELKEQLEEARERLQALQEKVWRAFGEKHMAEEEKKRRHRRGAADGGDGNVGNIEEADMAEGIYDEEIDGVEIEKESFSFLSNSSFDNFHKQREGKQKDREEGVETGRQRGLQLDVGMETAELWLGCGGLVRGEWDGEIERGGDEGEEGGQKFAQALKLELGSAVARVIDRVLRFYTEATDFTPSSPPASISFLPSDTGNDGGRERGVWMGLLMRERDGERRGKDERTGSQDGEREKRLQKMSNGSILPPGQSHRSESSDRATPLAVQRSPDIRKVHPLLGPPLSAHLAPSHPNLSLHHPSLPRPPPLSHPPLLPPPSQPKEPSSFHPSSSSSSTSSSSFPHPPPPPPPLPLPLLHYSMQQLFSRSLHHSQLPHLPASRKDYLNSDPFLEFPPHTSHPSFPPLPLLGHLDPSLTRHTHGNRERERDERRWGD